MPYKNSEDKLRWQREYYRNNREKVRKYHRDYRKKRRREDLRYAEQLRKIHKKWYDTHEYKRDEKKRFAQSLMYNYPDKYPLDSKCEFCGATENLEHAHIDYGYPELYITACHQCNLWMEKPMEVN